MLSWVYMNKANFFEFGASWNGTNHTSEVEKVKVFCTIRKVSLKLGLKYKKHIGDDCRMEKHKRLILGLI